MSGGYGGGGSGVAGGGGQLVEPFPTVGPLMRLALRELDLIASTPPGRASILGDPERMPRPWDPASVTDGDLRTEVWEWLEHVVVWLNSQLTWDVAGFVPPCWPRHPHLVHELAVLADQRRRAGEALTSDPLEEWYRYAVPSFTERLRARLQQHCHDGHHPWPGRSRHARATSLDAESERADLFEADLLAPSGADGLLRVRSVRVDRTTGEVQESE